MSRLRFVIACFLGGFVLALGVLLWNAKHLAGFRLGALQNMLPANVDMRLGNLVLSEAGSQGRTMAVRADSAHYFRDEDYFLLTDVAAEIETEDGRYVISADEGRYEPKVRLVFLTGAVRAADSAGRILTSARMDLDLNQKAFSSRTSFCLEDPGLSLSGSSFVYDAAAGQLQAEGRITMLITEGL
ncbi:MAG: LPS export ABC transporter periplasmic protein LptC [Deltaproteobacteria bacterium]|jgi:LPS export ABC transporter protein LptC|nr:LPS export ABC transporter periplasmic protein LptC [Deltaproteobacteria bacterium]